MLDAPNRDRMIRNPIAKKEYHFAATTEHHSEVIYADTIQEAEQLYHRAKRLINPPAPQSTPEQEDEPREGEVQ
jgi:hypothetical protein